MRSREDYIPMMTRTPNEDGFSLIEVMVSMVILAFTVLGVTAMFQNSNEGLQDGARGTQALAMADGRVEAKRTASWETLLTDDFDGDGVAEFRMHDDGMHGDAFAADGIYSDLFEKDGIRLIWTVQPIQPGPLERAGMVMIKAQATYQVGARSRTIETGTFRVNPAYVGRH
jgi:prepilin-type N-terminal cleavage/methylation domain-containing protein